jgi:hypothetical protein
MRYYDIEMKGRLILEKTTSIPIYNPGDEGRIFYYDNQLYYSDSTAQTIVGSGGGGGTSGSSGTSGLSGTSGSSGTSGLTGTSGTSGLSGTSGSSGTSGTSPSLTLQTTVLDIGDWNMDASASVLVPHGLTLSNIRKVSATIRNDANTTYYKLSGNSSGSQTGYRVQISTFDATNVVLLREAGGFFDQTDFNATSYNRGWVVITHV